MCVSALKAPSWIDTVDSCTFDLWPTALYLMPEEADLTHVFSVLSPLESSEQLWKGHKCCFVGHKSVSMSGWICKYGSMDHKEQLHEEKNQHVSCLLGSTVLRGNRLMRKRFSTAEFQAENTGKVPECHFCSSTEMMHMDSNHQMAAKTLSFGWWIFNLIIGKSGYLHRNQPINLYGTKRKITKISCCLLW